MTKIQEIIQDAWHLSAKQIYWQVSLISLELTSTFAHLGSQSKSQTRTVFKISIPKKHKSWTEAGNH